MKEWIHNRAALELTAERKVVLDLVNAAYDAIDTENVIRSSMTLTGNILNIAGRNFDLAAFKSISVIGFGKASCKAAYALEQVLGKRITQGMAVGLKTVQCQYIQTYGGAHPRPTEKNVELAQGIVDMGEKLGEQDLVIAIASGGGSSLLCWPMEECRQGEKLYEAFLKTGGDIKELNTVRKHISLIKGGGLAKILYPATVISLIFSDVPGDDYAAVASGPTYKDTSTVADAQKIIQKYNLGEFTLNETPKEAKYFEKVTNIPLVSNLTALKAIEKKAQSMGLKTTILSNALYDEAPGIISKFTSELKPGSVLIAGSEMKLVVTKQTGGKGGRCTYLANTALPSITENDTLAAIASDGLDNSDSAGAIVDATSLRTAHELNLNLKDYLERFDGYSLFEKTGHELLFTGPTEANVSDFVVWYRK